MIDKLFDFIRHRKEDFQDYLGGGVVARIVGGVVAVYFFAALVLGWYWSSEPELFDVNTIAEKAGVQYNIGPDELISVSNLPSATKVTNTRKFRSGVTEEDAQTFISRTKQELTERSLVTLRGVAAKLVTGFPEIDRLNVVGMNDPEMQRDILKGGGLGALRAGGNQGVVVADGDGQSRQRRFFTPGYTRPV